jgi:hypothetical protein
MRKITYFVLTPECGEFGTYKHIKGKIKRANGYAKIKENSNGVSKITIKLKHPCYRKIILESLLDILCEQDAPVSNSPCEDCAMRFDCDGTCCEMYE